jgi:hypothetical protein
VVLLYLFLIKEGLSRGKSKYFFLSCKVKLDFPESHIYASICSVKERMTKDEGCKHLSLLLTSWWLPLLDNG